jgi:predicted polyphosphate/ATP-dependent NAD kinase
MPSPWSEFSIGLVVNPIAGLGGAVGLKGSDDPRIQEMALQKGAKPKSGKRVMAMLAGLRERIRDRNVRFLTAAGAMGETWLAASGCAYDVCFQPTTGQATTADDTRSAVRAISSRGVDLLVFAGGDGTARDVLDAAEQSQVVLGLPCGVKMYSGVFVVTPIAAAELIAATQNR